MLFRSIKFNFGARPPGTPDAEIEAFNGVSAGKGHLTGGKAAPAETELSAK